MNEGRLVIPNGSETELESVPRRVHSQVREILAYCRFRAKQKWSQLRVGVMAAVGAGHSVAVLVFSIGRNEQLLQEHL